MLIHDPIDLIDIADAHRLSKSVVVPLKVVLPPLLQEQRGLVPSGGIPDHAEESEHPAVTGPLEGDEVEAPVRPGKPRHVTRRNGRLHLQEALVKSKKIRLRESRDGETMSFCLEQGAQPIDLGRFLLTEGRHADVAARASLKMTFGLEIAQCLTHRDMADAEAGSKDLRGDSLSWNESPFDQVLAD
jgi:hypothetical protein